MKLNNETRNQLLKWIEDFESNIGKNVYFQEYICTNKEIFDRHFTTYSSTEFKLIYFGVRFSGARIMFEGEKLYYEISFDAIINMEENSDEIVFLEAYSDKIYRKTILKISDATQ